jgi:hypothetical protein
VARRRPDSDRVLPIVRLVQEAKAAIEKREGRAIPLRELAQMTGIKYGTLRRYHDPELPPLLITARQQTIDVLSLGLDVPRSKVSDAFDRSRLIHYGKTDPEPGETAVSFVTLEKLDEEQQRAVIDDVLAWAREKGYVVGPPS